MRKHINRRAFVAGAAAGVSGLLLPSARSAQAGKTLKVGILLPFSGPQAQIGIDCRRGLEVALEVLRRRGYPDYELVFADTESKPDVARFQAERLIEQGIHVLIGCFDSGQTLAAAQVCEQRGIPLIVNIAAVPKLTEQGYKTVFRLFPTAKETTKDSFELQKLLFSSTGLTPATAVLFHIEDTLGGDRKKQFVRLAPQFGMPYKILDTVGYNPTTLSLSAEVRKVKFLKPELVCVVSRLNDGIQIVKEMVRQRFEPMGIISLGPAWYEVTFMNELGKHADDMISTVAWHDMRKPLARELETAFKKIYPDRELNLNHTYTFEALMVGLDAFRRAGSAEPGRLIETLRTTDITENVITGPGVRFDEKGQRIGGGASAVQNRNGKNIVVLPKRDAAAEVVWPMRPWNARG